MVTQLTMFDDGDIERYFADQVRSAAAAAARKQAAAVLRASLKMSGAEYADDIIKAASNDDVSEIINATAEPSSVQMVERLIVVVCRIELGRLGSGAFQTQEDVLRWGKQQLQRARQLSEPGNLCGRIGIPSGGVSCN